MAKTTSNLLVVATLFINIICLIPIAISDDATPIPENPAQIESWFNQNVKPASARKGSIDPELEAAEANPKIVTVRSDGSGDFKTIVAAVESIPQANKQRFIISIGPGTYKERIKVERTKPFVTFYGTDPKNQPLLTSSGNALQYGTVDSATLIVEADYFQAVNIKMENTAERPPKGVAGKQALAFRISGDKASFYNCRFSSFQDTLCDNYGQHFYKDCFIEGTIDFIFGDGKSIYLNSEIHVIPGDDLQMITAQAGGSKAEDEGFSIVHCKVTGTGGGAYLGRAWMSFPKVVYSYCDFSDVVQDEGWSNSWNNANNKTVYFGEYNCKGVKADMTHRAKFVMKMTDADAARWLSLGFIKGSSWLLPPAKL